MPVTKSAKKALKQAVKRKGVNDKVRRGMRAAVKDALSKKNPDALKKAYSELDRAVKLQVIHKNKSSRLKSRLAKALQNK